MACTQCRSRKLRCDREYPVCGRCIKSKTPAKCTYEDGFLWQQPNTIASTTFSNNNSDRRGSTNASSINTTAAVPVSGGSSVTPNLLPRVVDPSPRPDSGLSSLSAASVEARPGPLFDPQQLPQSAPTTAAAAAAATVQSEKKQPPVVEERRDRFLETVLGAPKTEDPGLPTDLFQRSRRPEHHYHHNHHHHHPHHVPSHHVDGDDSDGLASPSQKLDISPRIMMRGKETQTRFNGAGIMANLIAQVNKASIIRICYRHSDLTGKLCIINSSPVLNSLLKS